MSVLKDARQKAGYDTEEFWFHQRERELIAQMKQKERNLKLIQGGRSPSSTDASQDTGEASAERSGPSAKKAA